MAFLVDKYRPLNLGDLTYHREQANRLSKIVKAGDFPHLLVHGPSGAGKTTRIFCILRELYGAGVEKLRLGMKNIVAPSGKKLEIHTVSSNYHVQLSPSDVGIYDRVVVQEVIKEMAQMQQLDTGPQKNFKIVLLFEADRLTRDAQDALRRTMEKYSSTCRLILCCESISKLSGPLRSRCMAVRVSSPTNADVENAIRNVCKKESIIILDSLIESIVEKAGGNMRRALLMLEAAKSQCYPFKENQNVPIPDWEIYLQETASMVLRQQSSENLLKVRERLYETLSRCIPASIILQYLMREFLKKCGDKVKIETVAAAAEFEHRLNSGRNAIFHLEAFIATFMDIYHADSLDHKK